MAFVNRVYGKHCKLTEAQKDAVMEFVCSNATMFVDYWWADIKAAAKALLKRETLTGDEILDVIHTAKAKRSSRSDRSEKSKASSHFDSRGSLARRSGEVLLVGVRATAAQSMHQRGALTTCPFGHV